MSAARDRAMFIPEVLELILLQLPLQELLINAQRVNHFFYDLIRSSRPLQQALFFHPADGILPTKVLTNSLLQKKFPLWFEHRCIIDSGYRIWNHQNFHSLDWNSGKDRTEAYARKEASWRRMLVAQSPVRDLTVRIRTRTTEGSGQSRGDLKLKDGLRMGLFYDLVQDFVEQNLGSRFVIRWFLPPACKDEDGNIRHTDDDGEERASIYVYLRQETGFLTGKIGSEFKSLAYEPIEIDYFPLLSEETHAYRLFLFILNIIPEIYAP